MRGKRRSRFIVSLVFTLLAGIVFTLSLLEVDASHAPAVSMTYRLALSIQMVLYFVISLFVLSGTLSRDLAIIITVCTMFSTYVAKLFSKGVYIAFIDRDLTIMPSMRSPAAYIMLSTEGRINFQLDPHYFYPLEYLITYITSCVTGVPYHLSYILNVGLSILILNSVIIYILVLRNIRLFNQQKVSAFLLVASLAILFNLLDVFYLAEFAYARSLFYLALYIECFKFASGKLGTLEQCLSVFLLAVGTIVGSLRISLVLSIVFLTLVVAFLAKKTRTRLKLDLGIYVAVTLFSIIYMFYFGSQYVTGYSNYLEALAVSLWSVLEHGIFEIKRPPLHTIVQVKYHHDLYRVMSTLGGTSLLTLLSTSYLTVLACFILRLIDRGKRILLRRSDNTNIGIGSTLYEDTFSITSLLFGGVLGIAYLLNILGLFTIDFESMTDLLLPLPLAMMFNVHRLEGRKDLRGRTDVTKFNTILKKLMGGIFITFIVTVAAFSVFGLGLRHPVLCIAETTLTPSNAVIGLQYANEFFTFLVIYGGTGHALIDLSTDYSSLYLTLILRYYNVNITSSTSGFGDGFISSGSIVFNNLVYILIENGKVLTVVDNIRVLPL